MLFLCREKARPGPQVFKKSVEPAVHLMVPRDFPVSLLDVLHHVDDLAQDTVECGNRVVGWRSVGGRTSPFHEEVRVLVELMRATLDATAWARQIADTHWTVVVSAAHGGVESNQPATSSVDTMTAS